MDDRGTFKLYQASLGEGSAGIIVSMDSLMEVDESGIAVGASGPPQDRHSVQNFDHTSLLVQPAEDVLLGTARAATVNLKAAIGSVGELKLELFQIFQAGDISIDEDSWHVSSGDLKWNIVFPRWSFCSPCKKDNEGATKEEWGEYLDFTILVEGLYEANLGRGENATSGVDLGQGTMLHLSRGIEVDGSTVQMSPGYPLVEVAGRSAKIIFRFPKFDASVNYDPLMKIGDPMYFEYNNNIGASSGGDSAAKDGVGRPLTVGRLGAWRLATASSPSVALAALAVVASEALGGGSAGGFGIFC